MKHILSRFFIALTILLIPIMAPLAVSAKTSTSSASTNDFYFKDATFDYYLEKTDTGSKMHVKEVLTAVFPETDQNHGITRAIPFSNMDGKNITVESKDALNLTVKRNGADEPVAKVEKDEDEYIIYVGKSSEYVHGEQVYTLEYDFYNVITEFDKSGVNISGEHSNNVDFQELYWDTNGTGWSQEFDKLTANLHLPADIAKNLRSGTSCYVGYYGQHGASRCTITSNDESTYSPAANQSTTTIDTGIKAAEVVLTFETENLAARENLTFAVDFNAGTFIVPDLPKDYTLVVATVVCIAICATILFFVIRHYLKNGYEKRKFYKSLFIAPQYAPEKSYHVAEANMLCMSRTENSYVATLLELATSKKVSIIKGEPTKVLKKDTWSLKINSTKDLSDSQTDLLKILNGGKSIEGVDEIQIKKYTATSTLASLSRRYLSDATDKLKKLGLFEDKTKAVKNSNAVLAIIFAVIIFIFVWPSAIFAIFGTAAKFIASAFGSGYGEMVGADILPFIIGVIAIGTIVITTTVSTTNSKYKKYTEKGLKSAAYLEGLKLYIKMAEAERIKFLQSVKGADVSEKGIVKLYETLLPYAALFGLEDSWMDEFNRYCKEINYSPDWYSGDEFLTGYMLGNMVSHVNHTVSSSTSYSNSSSGGSSFSSGGGGGGFSGGGGGGGGGGGW